MFRFELVKSMLPADQHKILVNIRKTEARNKRRKLVMKTGEDGSDTEDEKPKVKAERYSVSKTVCFYNSFIFIVKLS